MPFRMGPMEIALILLIVLMVFGVGKLPQVGSAIGRGIREFRKAQRGDFDEEEKLKQKPAAQLTKPVSHAEEE
jgi:sec-independent protein translocase protein TatA